MLEFIPSEVDLFTQNPIQTCVEDEAIFAYNPLTSLERVNTITFNVPSILNRYKDLNYVFLKLTLQIAKENGENFLSDDKATAQPVLINNILHSLFKNCTVELNNKIVSSTSMYHYKSYFENLLNFQKSRVDTLLKNEGWYLDTAGKMEVATKENDGCKNRLILTENSKTIEMYGKLHIDIFNLSKYLISGVDLKITMEMEKPSFYFMNTDKAMIKMHEAKLFVRHVAISKDMILAHNQILSSKNINYDFTRNQMKNFTIPSGVTNHNIENLFNGQLPQRLLIALVENESFNGSVSKNPFNFQHFHLQQIGINVNGVNIPAQPYTLNAENGLASKAYADLYYALNCHFKDFGLQFDVTGFLKGFAIYGFETVPLKRLGHSANNSLLDNGIMKVEMKFSRTLNASVTAIVYAEFANTFEVSHNKTIILDY